MSSAQVKHEVLFLFTNRLLLQQALHYSSTFSRSRQRERSLLSLYWICIFLCQVFNVSQKLYYSPGRDVWSIKRLKRHYFLRTPSISHPCGFFFPSVGDMRAAANKLFCQPSDEPQWTSVKDYKISLSVFRNWNVTSFWPVRERKTSSLRAKQDDLLAFWPEFT